MSLLDAWQSVLDVVTPYKGVIAGTAGFLGAIGASVWGALRQRRRDDALPVEAAAVGPRPTVTRLHAEDRELLSDVREAVQEMSRSVRRLCGILQDEADERHRRGGNGGGGGGTFGL